MTFNDDAQLDTSQVGSGGGGGGGFRPGGMVLGGGGGCLSIIVLIVVMLLNGGLPGGGGSDSAPPQSQQRQQQDPYSGVDGGGQLQNDDFSQCRTGADANRDDTCRAIGTVNSVQNFWARKLPEDSNGRYDYRQTKTILYQGQTSSKCGQASNDVGPFYCPLDRQVYLDVSFFDILSRQFGSSSGSLAQMYVVAHEYGHSVQDQLGLLERAQQDPKGAESGGVKVELMADCLAGMWVKDAATTKDKNGATLLKAPTQAQIDDALSAATAVGDDHIMKSAGRGVNPDNFTHGTSEQRRSWFMKGYQQGTLQGCNTFAAGAAL